MSDSLDPELLTEAQRMNLRVFHQPRSNLELAVIVAAGKLLTTSDDTDIVSANDDR